MTKGMEKIHKVLSEMQKADKAAKSPWRRALGAAAVGGGLGVGLGAAASGVDAVEDKLKYRSSYKGMLKGNPDLAKTPKATEKYFKTLRRFSPEVSKDPLAAGAFVRRMKDFKDIGLPMADVSSLSQIQKNLMDAKSRSHGKGEYIKSIPSSIRGVMEMGLV